MCCLKFFMKLNTEGGHEKLKLKDLSDEMEGLWKISFSK